MVSHHIKNLQNLLQPILDRNHRFVGAKISKLTAAGDNYGSLMLRVDVSIEDDQNQTKTRYLVAKMLPDNEILQKMFNSKVTFRNEVGFYQSIAPCLRQLQKEQGFNKLFNAFPTFYSARNSLDPSSNKVDEDAVLLIKNINDEGFTNIDRMVGFDLEQTKLILTKMAELHATFLAFEALKPDFFAEKLGQFFEEYTLFDAGKDKLDKMLKSLVDMVKDDELCSRNLDKIVETLNNTTVGSRNNKKSPKGLFFSFAHCDMWSNNIMVKIVDSKTVDVKFIDFQIYEQNSSVKDVIFFLFTSVQLPVIQQYCDELLGFYYDNFINDLKKLDCDITEFSFEIFTEEIKHVLKTFEFFHILLMFAPIYAKKEDTSNLEDMSLDEIIDQRGNVSEECKRKACFTVQEFIRRNWI